MVKAAHFASAPLFTSGFSIGSAFNHISKKHTNLLSLLNFYNCKELFLKSLALSIQGNFKIPSPPLPISGIFLPIGNRTQGNAIKGTMRVSEH